MPLALLLFLICAMTASIVLAAGTTAAGRASTLAESDQAYYSVTSAVNLFREQLEGADGQGHPVTVAVKSDSSGSSAATYQVVVTTDGKAAGASYSLIERAALYLLFGKIAQDSAGAQAAANAAFTTADAWRAWPDLSEVSAGSLGTFNVNPAGGGLDAVQSTALQLEVEANMTDDGSLVLTFQKPGADADDYLAIFNLTCEADLETGSLETAASNDGSSAGSEIKYATVTWMPSAVEKG